MSVAAWCNDWLYNSRMILIRWDRGNTSLDVSVAAWCIAWRSLIVHRIWRSECKMVVRVDTNPKRRRGIGCQGQGPKGQRDARLHGGFGQQQLTKVVEVKNGRD